MVSNTPRPHFTPGKEPVSVLQEGGWAPGPVWTDGKSRPHRDSIPDRPARSQSLYQLSYPAHIFTSLVKGNVYYFCEVLQINRVCSLKLQCMCYSDIPSSSPAKEFWRCPNDMLDNFPHFTYDRNLSHYKTLVLIYLLFEISDKNKSNRL